MEKFRDAIIGLVVGDALGLPSEHVSRWKLQQEPVMEMLEYRSHFKPKGTWSTTSSLALATMASLAKGLNYDNMMHELTLWQNEHKFTCHNETIEVPLSYYNAISRYHHGIPALECGGIELNNNYSSSLPRMIPLAIFLFKKVDPSYWHSIIESTTKIIHGHPLSIMASALFIDVFLELYHQSDCYEAIQRSLDNLYGHYSEIEDAKEFLPFFNRLSNLGEFLRLDPSFIHSTDNVIDTLETVFYCLLSTDNYKDAVLMAVNFGSDSASNGALTSCLATLLYGREAIDNEWLMSIENRDLIIQIIHDFESSLMS